MLDHEYNLLLERLDDKLGDERTFFVFADTVAARSFKQRNESHGWLGVRCQMQTRSEPSQIIIHVRMLDEENVDQQEALGVIGVNLLYGAFYHRQPEKLISSLHENLAPGRLQVDMLKFSGPGLCRRGQSADESAARQPRFDKCGHVQRPWRDGTTNGSFL
jgi:hypothetical protein